MDPSFESEAYVPDRLIAGDLKLITRDVTLTDNQGIGALSRGTVLSMNNAGVYAATHQTGAFVAGLARAVLAKAADPSGGDVTASIYELGEFNEDALVLNGTVSAADVQEPLRVLGIFLKSPVSAV